MHELTSNLNSSSLTNRKIFISFLSNFN